MTHPKTSVSRDGIVTYTANGDVRRLGYVDRDPRQPAKWRAILEGGALVARADTRTEATNRLVSHVFGRADE